MVVYSIHLTAIALIPLIVLTQKLIKKCFKDAWTFCLNVRITEFVEHFTTY
ncbi:hypothetical protein Riv7116_1665 [Rivularia sp. PCC 7116]|nr:hypothetical protein Riv7116_1665 [Rivularia sp. PCC 7116]